MGDKPIVKGYLNGIPGDYSTTVFISGVSVVVETIFFGDDGSQSATARSVQSIADAIHANLTKLTKLTGV